MKLTVPYLASVGALIILDALWLGVIMRDFYDEGIGHLRADGVNWIVAGLFYFFYVAGLFVLAVLPALRGGKLKRVATLGALLGLFAYGTYDLTNLAVLEDWPFLLSVVDVLWGTFVSMAVSCLGFVLVRRYNKERVTPVG